MKTQEDDGSQQQKIKVLRTKGVEKEQGRYKRERESSTTGIENNREGGERTPLYDGGAPKRKRGTRGARK